MEVWDRLKRKIFINALVVICSVLMISGCQDMPEQESNNDQSTDATISEHETSYPIERTDANERNVVIEQEPQSIVSLIPSNTEIVYALGAGDRMVGRSEFDDYPEEVLDIQSIGGMEFDVEQIIELEPDIILAHESGSTQAEHAFEQLEKAGYPVFVVEDAQTIDAVYESIEEIAELLNRQTEAEQIIEQMTTSFAQLEDITEKDSDEQHSVWVEISPQPIYVAGKETFIDELLRVSHATNAAEDQTGWVEISEEIGVTYDPDVIISTYGGAESISEKPAWQRVSAIQKDRVFDIDPNLVSRPGPRLVEGAWQLAELIYPEDF